MNLSSSIKRVHFHNSLRRQISVMTSTPKYQALHDPEKKEFFIQLKGHDKALLQYDYITKSKVELYHTGVPTSYRGHGIAGILAETAIKYFKENGMEMELTCSYLQHYVSKHPST
ncbi:protein NATD1-like isoform X1 [Saccostrea echinata]|uniref:protein NATD1-like isoform X1 n=1 Tax=Saccostrea echinata TaxID=191078 RepID=UPI002A7EABAC|nr:protein NATD1-like isoform X1 [Saccostrea echinata]